ncbi:hypothetical protein KKC32_01460 [Patescibacteria group bacterium]|nr:hypothetical protein [Patescibacteria group bacterium]
MKKKLIWAILAVLIVGGLVYFKVYYPNSQLQLKNAMKHVDAFAVENYFNSEEKSCGIWYESYTEAETKNGRDNQAVKDCFIKAFSGCSRRSVLIVSDKSQTAESKITYSLIRIINDNDRGECIVQNSYEEQNLNEPKNELPVGYVNTCTALSEDLISSCEPIYIKDAREKESEPESEEVSPENQ